MNDITDEKLEPEGPECRICLIEHDEAVHTATLNVRRWFRRQVVRNFEEEYLREPRVA